MKATPTFSILEAKIIMINVYEMIERSLPVIRKDLKINKIACSSRDNEHANLRVFFTVFPNVRYVMSCRPLIASHRLGKIRSVRRISNG